MTSLLTDAIDLKDIEIGKHKKEKTKLKQSIASKDKVIKQHQQTSHKNKLAVKRYGKSVIKRTRRMITRTIAYLPSKSIPILGSFIAVGSVLWEIQDTCQQRSEVTDDQ